MTSFVDNLTVEGLLQHGSKVSVPSTQATSASTLALTVSSNMAQYFTGTAAGQILKLPNATTLINGQRYEIYNQSSVPVSVQDGSGATLFSLSQTSIAYLTLQTNGTVAGGWIAWQILISSSASGIVNYQVTSTTTFSTASASYVVITGFTVTPQAGTYAIWYSGQALMAATPKSHSWAIFRAGVIIQDSERAQDTAHSNQNMNDSTMTIATFDGTQTCDVRVWSSSGTLQILGRSLILIRMGS
jgi:hypothetical protein